MVSYHEDGIISILTWEFHDEVDGYHFEWGGIFLGKYQL